MGGMALLAGYSPVMGAPAKEIIIGNLQDMSGPTSVWGNAVTRGAELAAEKINAQGGINGAKIKMITLDTKGDVQEAIKAFNRLVDQDKGRGRDRPADQQYRHRPCASRRREESGLRGQFCRPPGDRR